MNRQMTAQFQNVSVNAQPPPQSQSTPQNPSAPPPVQPAPSNPTPSFLHPSSNQWQSTSDFLPPPPAPPIMRSGGIPAPTPQEVSTPRRITRSQGTPRGDIGDKDRNPYKKGNRREGGGVV
jgi:programmed cell death 6-interacting protein